MSVRRHAELAGLKPNFTILDADDQVRLLKQVLGAENIDEKRWPARTLAILIDGWKNRGLTPSDVSEGEGGGFAFGRARALYSLYQARLKALNAADFGDLLLEPIVILRSNAEILADYQSRFAYMLVDEYQDTNTAQYMWLRLIAQGSKNVCCVGDDDQSIYGWRGAEVDNILRFEKDFPGATVIRLERNYRSTGHILAAASHLIAHNEGRLGKTLRTEDVPGEKVTVTGAWDSEEEARGIGEEIEQLQRKKHKLDEIAILVRAGFQTREFEERFIGIGLPYQIIGGFRFYERAEIKDAVAYLQVIDNPFDGVSLARIANRPRRGIGDASIARLQVHADARGISLFEALGQAEEAGVGAAPLKAVRRLHGLLQRVSRGQQDIDQLRIDLGVAGTDAVEDVLHAVAELGNGFVTHRRRHPLDRVHGSEDGIHGVAVLGLGFQGEEGTTDLCEVFACLVGE